MEPISFDIEFCGESKRICLLDWPESQTPEQLGSLLVTKYAAGLEHTQLLVLRPAVDIPFGDPSIRSNELARLVRRVPRATIYILYSHNFAHKLSSDLVNSREDELPESSRNGLINLIREHELEYYAKNSDALLPDRSGFVYKSPSGQYVRQFLRVGNIQKTRQALNSVFFWMLPHLKGCGAIIVDTWSIGSVALNSARLLERYDNDLRCGVEMFPTYFDGSSDSRSSANSILRRGFSKNNQSVLVLFSAIRTENSINNLKNFLNNSYQEINFNFLAIYALTKTNRFSALCSKLNQIDFSSTGKENAVITIDSSSYFPVVVKDKELSIRKVNADSNKKFFDEISGTKAVRIHRDVHDITGKFLGHHAYDIEVESLLEEPKFLKKFHSKLQSLQNISIVVVPPHNAGIRLGNEACDYFSSVSKIKPKLIVHADLLPKNLREDDKHSIQNSNLQTRILILDDVSTTGLRLSNYQVNLRNLNFQGRISYLVGIARPDDEKLWKRRIRNLTPSQSDEFNNEVLCVEKIVLPNWEKERCPWCMEYDWLTEMLVNVELNAGARNLVNDRREILLNAKDNEGLIDNVFWIPPNGERPKLTQGSIFLKHLQVSEADVVASVAGAIQRMRVCQDDNFCLRHDFPQPRILSPEDYLIPAPSFNDHVLQIAILRSVLSSELRRWNDKEEENRVRRFHNLFVNEQDSLALEHIVAIVQGKFSTSSYFNIDLESIRLPEIRVILDRVLNQLNR